MVTDPVRQDKAEASYHGRTSRWRGSARQPEHQKKRAIQPFAGI